MLVPLGLSNVWIASRCLGVSQDAHYSTRVQRDIQRVGEAAGFAAAEAVKHGETAQELSYAGLSKWLIQTGALSNEPRNIDTGFAWAYPSSVPSVTLTVPEILSSASDALAALDRGEPGVAMWWLYRHKNFVYDAVIERLVSRRNRKPMVGWMAAAVVAMWKNPAAEPRLVEAIDSLEYGYGDGYEWMPARGLKLPGQTPLELKTLVPNWLCALALLRICGTETCLPTISQLINRPVHGIDSLITSAITIEHLFRRGVIASNEGKYNAEAILHRILTVRIVGAAGHPGPMVGWYSERAIRGEYDGQLTECPRPALAYKDQLKDNACDVEGGHFRRQLNYAASCNSTSIP